MLNRHAFNRLLKLQQELSPDEHKILQEKVLPKILTMHAADAAK
jgi:hypothetical protein